jgi:lipopolysaccharide/colanic/teichoic acid biosynthesis glycosyltransferase
MAIEAGAEPGTQPLNVREFPDTSITSSPTVPGEPVSYYDVDLWQLKWKGIIPVRQQRNNEASVETKEMNCSIEAHQLDYSPSFRTDPVVLWKRTLDVILILLVLPLLIPLALLLVLLIRRGSRGPVLFRQERIGHQGRRFMCFKFRTMFVDADTITHQGHLLQLMQSNAPMMKMDSRGDPRIMPFGVLLRASGLDELPQLINVLRGEMSLVGPRPCLPYEYDNYLPWQKERFETVPGLTGLWQVSGKNKTTFVEMIQLDIKYAKNKTLWWDLKIILMTVPALVIQMLETRQAGKASSRPVRRKTSYSNGTAQPHSFATSALAGAVQARGGEDVWMRKETKLNL